MNKRIKEFKLYNVIFPVWLLFIWPITWLLVLPCNFIIDSIVLIIGLFVLKCQNKFEVYKKTILYIFLFGFIADIIGGLFMLLTQLFNAKGWFYEFIIAPIAQNPFDNIYCLIYTIIAVIISGVLIYIFNRFISFRKLTDNTHKKILALLLAVLTAPYLFLVPTSSVYGYSTDSFSNHIVWSEYIKSEVYTDESNGEDIFVKEDADRFNYSVTGAFREAVNFAEKVDSEKGGRLKYTVVFYRESNDKKPMQPIEFFEKNGVLYFEWKNDLYMVTNDDYQYILRAINEIYAAETEDIMD